MVIAVPKFEPRLQLRYRQLMGQHLRTSHGLAAGLGQLPSLGQGFAAAQAAWRFYANPRVSLPQLAEPLLEYAKQAVAKHCATYVLVSADWSPLHYTHHQSKADRIKLYGKDDLGYLLHSALALSDKDGQPLAPLYLGVEAADGLHSHLSEKPIACEATVDEALRIARAVADVLLTKLHVLIFDRALDSLWHLRQLAAQPHLFLIRGNDVRRVEHEGESRLLEEVEATLVPQFKYCRKVVYQGQKLRQYVAEATLTLKQPARRQRFVNGKVRYQLIKGEPLTLRYVVAQLRDRKGQVLATWRLWTNVPTSVKPATIVQWYYWRWRIESTFQLFKRGGQHLEQWQQETALAIAKRLMIAAHACVLVWALQQETQDEKVIALRQLLIDLSGRLMRRGVEHTAPALLAGLWNLLAIIDAMERYPLHELLDSGQQLIHMLGLEKRYPQFKELV